MATSDMGVVVEKKRRRKNTDKKTSDEVNMGVVVEKKRRRKNTDKKIDDKSSLQVTFSKRRQGLFKKAKVLRESYNADVGIVVFSPAGRPFAYEPHTRPVLERYLRDHDADGVPAVGLINWWDTVDVAKVGSEELHAMYNALEELHRRVLAHAHLLAASAAGGGRCLAPEHACEPPLTLGFPAAAPIDCTGEEGHVQLCVPHYRSTTTSAIDYGRPLVLPATMEVEASGGGHLSPSPGYFAMAGEDPLQGQFLAAVPMDCTGELSQVDREDVQLYASHEISTYQSTIEPEGPAVLPVAAIDVDAQASCGDCPAERPEFLMSEEEQEGWERFWPELDNEAFREELLAASSVAEPGTGMGILKEAAAGEYAMLPPLDLESFWEVPPSYWTSSLIPNSF